VKPGEEDTKAVELVLIRRRGAGDEAPHKGGVWKIAYADFMTAMMAFFLVMWLINSTDQKVLTQVANYFNPLRLTDNTPHERGLRDIESGEQGKQGKEREPVDAKEKNKAKQKPQETNREHPAPGEEAVKEHKQASGAGKARYSEQALFSDPYGVLARIAADATSDGSPQTAPQDPKSYRDPFDPAAKLDSAGKPTLTPKANPAVDTKTATAVMLDELRSRDLSVLEQSTAARTNDQRAREQPANLDDPKVVERAAAPKPAPQQAASQATVRQEPKDSERAAAKAAEQEAASRAEAEKIEAEVKRAVSQLRGTVPNMDVTVTEDGVLISLTDDTDFGMFAIASAEPRPAMVVIMERIAKIVQAHPHPLIVRGHTDGRPYRSGTYDNWRLSSARAHMAYYMLVRGGVDEKRFERIEGHADRSLRVPGDPGAAQNRRIEILLRRQKP
jgi:chemotaxis protein MotB